MCIVHCAFSELKKPNAKSFVDQFPYCLVTFLIMSVSEYVCVFYV